jgi:CRP/FNR family transcriptional regulator, cyclic AMP receptor protein
MQTRRLGEPPESFGSLPRAIAEQLAARAMTRRYRRGEYICHAGEPATRLFVVDTGRIAIAVRARDGRESVAAVLGPGSLFGELPFFDGEPRSSDARALTPVLLGEVDYDAVRAVIAEQPSLLWDVAMILTRRLRATDEALADAMFLDVTGRTAKRLLQIAGSDDEFSLPVTQEELAAMVGASRERVNKAIATFVRLGWLQVSARTRYRILDRAELDARTRV